MLVSRVATAVACLFLVLAGLRALPARAAAPTTGSITGTVTTPAGEPVAGAHVVAASGSGRYAGATDSRGRFTLLGVQPDTYVVTIDATGRQPAIERSVAVLPGQNQVLVFQLAPALTTIGSTRASSGAFARGATSDVFTISGDQARALAPPISSSGLGNYLSGTVQGAIASVPGVDIDAFGNAILRGGKVDDALFEYDSVAVPQGLIAEPGGNIVGAQLPTTGVATTTVTLAGYGAESENALGGIVDQIPAVGVYPARTTINVTDGVGTLDERIAVLTQFATPDLRWRYAFAATLGDQYFSYGDGHTFYPSEIATYGLSLQSRGESSFTGNIHFRLDENDDLSVLGLAGSSNYQQYDSPYSGETAGAFGYSGELAPSALRGTYDILKLQWLHTSANSVSRVQAYQTQYGSVAGGAFWDDLSFPDGVIALQQQQGSRQTGASYDDDIIASDHQRIRVGADISTNTSFLDQVVPTADELITSHPTLISYLAYAGDTWSFSRVAITGTARMTDTDIVVSNGPSYTVGAIDPHASAAYELGSTFTLRATFDRTTVAPKPLEAERLDTSNELPSGAEPYTPLAPETANDFTYSFESTGKTQVRLTYYAEHENNRIDVLPENFRSVVSSDASPSGVGIPTNAGELIAHGAELWVKRGGFTFDANYIRGYSSSASQFAYNDLNAPAIAAGHLFPLGYVPPFTATLSYDIKPVKHLRITPELSYENGYPYGNGKMVYIFNPVTGKPEQVPNDNYVNPGENYYFLANPNEPYNAQTNPYIGSLGTPEGNDPNTLRSTPQLLVNLHVEGDLTPRLTAIIDVENLFGVSTPTEEQVNPYLIGPPGYAGGNPNYATAYQGAAGFASPYVLGNGVPTNDGVNPAVPWTYGRSGYVPQGYPLARTVWAGLRYTL